MSYQWSTRFTPYADGRHVVGLGTLGCGTVLIDGKVVLENVESRQPGDLFFTSGSEERRATIELKAGKEVLVEVRHWTPPHLVARGPFAAMGIKAAGEWTSFETVYKSHPRPTELTRDRV